jgi:NAD(P)H-dependent FMN reductase
MTPSAKGSKRNGEKGLVRVLVFSASLRKDSLNTRLAKLVALVLEKNGGKADIANMNEFDCPPFNQDLVPDGSHPAGAEQFKQRLLANDAFIIASPEYNGSMPGNLKNSIDWVSRFRPQPFHEHNGLLMSASPSMAGGAAHSGLCGSHLNILGQGFFPEMFSLAMAHQGFTSEGKINNAALAKRFEDTIAAFMSLVEAVKNYPCIKKEWIEFLGEKPEMVTARVE